VPPGMYEARCRAHCSPFSDEHGIVQLELETTRA
jgi:hypothetical protein